MNKPTMILFDYGYTLALEKKIDYLCGYKALAEYITLNKKNYSAMQLNELRAELFRRNSESSGVARLSQIQFLRFLFEYCKIEISIPYPEVESIFCNASCFDLPMPHVEELLDYLNAKSIRCALVSNNSWSSAVLSEAVNRLLPRNKFEFVISSSDYMFRKPNPLIFELALQKAALNANDVWFCGDSLKADVNGSASVGMYPVWYEADSIVNDSNQVSSVNALNPIIHINNWLELISILNGLERF